VRQLKWKGDIPRRTAPTQESGVLKGDSNIRSSRKGRRSQNENLTRIRLQQASGEAEERGLAASVSTEECDALPCLQA